jgi:2-desacetyl-2-hydroxyethyl bacteriochlorophyllide A dehydrogenase
VLRRTFEIVRALIFKAPDQAEIISVPEPAVASDDVLLRVQMVGLCGSDLNSFRGKNPMVSYPRIPGHEISATVVESPRNRADFVPGVNVTLSPYFNCGKCAACLRGRPNACQFNQTLGVQRDGALTEYISIPANRLYTAKLSLKELCLVEPLTVGAHAAGRGRIAPHDTVAVLGAGGVGLGVIAAAHFRGARTIAVDLEEEKLQLARAAGADHAINARAAKLQQQLNDLTDGRGPDVVVEAIGTPETFRTAVEVVASTGRVVYIGWVKEPVDYETRLFVQKELDILGSRNALPEDFRDVIRMLEEHRFPVDQAVSSIVPLEDAPRALSAWSENPARVKKIMVRLT